MRLSTRHALAKFMCLDCRAASDAVALRDVLLDSMVQVTRQLLAGIELLTRPAISSTTFAS